MNDWNKAPKGDTSPKETVYFWSHQATKVMASIKTSTEIMKCLI